MCPAATASSGYVFISYARDDGAEFAKRLQTDLAGSGVNVWVDTTQIAAGDRFAARLQDALRDARAVLIILTPGAIASSYVEGEWHDALNRYTPILPLFAHECEMPVGLRAFEYLDFRTDYAAPFKRLVERLSTLDDAQLAYLKANLATLRKTKRTATDPRRFDPKISALKAKIAEIEGRVRQRPPVPPPEDATTGRVVTTRTQNRRCRRAGKSPLESLLQFRDRTAQQREIVRLIEDDACRMISVLGRGGMGKTALALAVLERLAGDDGAPLDGIAFLSARTSGLELELVFEYCASLLDDAPAGSVRAVWGDPTLADDAKIERLLEMLAGSRIVILLDNIEDVLDDHGDVTNTGLGLFVGRAVRHRPGPTLVVTSRVPVRLPATVANQDVRIELREGLPEADAIEFLRDLDQHSEYGLRESPEDVLRGLAVRLHAVPRALEVAASILEHNPYLSPDDVARNYYSFDDVVERIVEDNYRGLDADSRRVLEAAAVFRRPISPAALEFVLQPFVSGVNVQSVTARLARSHALTIDRMAKTVSLHPIDTDYAYSCLTASDTIAVADVERQAAAWYRRQRANKTAAGSTILEDFENQLLEFDHLMRAQDFDEAMDVLSGIDNLLTWSGHAGRVKQMLESLRSRLSTPRARMQHAIARGDNHYLFGEITEGRAALAEARELVTNFDDPVAKSRIVSTQAGIENTAGVADVALALFEEALPLFRAAGDTQGEKYCIFDLALLFAGRRHVAGLARYAEEMRAFAERMHDAGAHALAINVQTLAWLAGSDWPAAAASAQSLFDIYREIQQENWFPAVDNMLGLAAVGMRQWEQAAGHFRKAFTDAMAVQHFQYAARSAFNLAWTHYREGRHDRFLALVREAAALSSETREMIAFDALKRAVECAAASNVGAQARALLECAKAARGNIDLWDASDIATEALILAEAAQAGDIAVDASAFLASCRQDSGSADMSAV